MSQQQQQQQQEAAAAKLTPKKKLNNTFRGFGCTAAASQQVSLPAVIRSSADWDAKKVKKKKHKNSSKKSSSSNSNCNNDYSSNNNHSNISSSSSNNNNNNPNNSLSSCGVAQDVWCGPGIGFSASDAVVGSVDCVVTTRRNVVPGRGKIDNHHQRERERERERERDRDRDRERERERDRELACLLKFVSKSFTLHHESLQRCLARRTMNSEFPFPDFDSPFALARPELDVFGPRYYRHVRHPSPDGLAELWTPPFYMVFNMCCLLLLSSKEIEMMMLQNSLLMGGRVDSHDHFSDWRLDVDNMSYEELLELGDRIGYVSTGLKEDEIGRCLRKLKNSIINDLSSHLPLHVDKKCTICQEEYEADDEMGKLDCGHSFHIQCIKQWLSQKNACPVCKAAVVNRC
ncbi:RING-type domain-containing protein [Citrus sinensis]|uniref:RING-type domain-containing protein n=1 Tax=Citrus sinensis TaxID=2711 RepID=A0ACB8M0Q0_CITSI|nr:RING-type domain-containing protein [Citrus sinensis]